MGSALSSQATLDFLNGRNLARRCDTRFWQASSIYYPYSQVPSNMSGRRYRSYPFGGPLTGDDPTPHPPSDMRSQSSRHPDGRYGQRNDTRARSVSRSAAGSTRADPVMPGMNADGWRRRPSQTGAAERLGTAPRMRGRRGGRSGAAYGLNRASLGRGGRGRGEQPNVSAGNDIPAGQGTPSRSRRSHS